MAAGKTPPIGEFLDSLERRRVEREEAVHHAAAKRRRAAERFRRLADEVVAPVVRDVERELSRRRHAIKLHRREDSLRVTVLVHGRHARTGALEIVAAPGDAGGAVRLAYEGIEALPNRFEIELDKADRGLVTRAVLRLVEGLTAG